MNLLINALRWYDQKLFTAPYLTQMVTNGPLWASGDLAAQWLENKNRKKKKPIDWVRVARFSAYGFCVAGPLFAWWYGYIERRWMHLRLKGDWTKYLVAKIGCDQVRFEFLLFQTPEICTPLPRRSCLTQLLRMNYASTTAYLRATVPSSILRYNGHSQGI
jgi:hypothetical protein